MSKNTFFDPATSTTDTWLVNHESLDGPSRPSQVQYDSRSSLLGVIPTQGDAQPLIFTLKGRILHRSQYTMFWRYKELTNSFRFTDEEEQEFEVTMTGLEVQKARCTYNPFDPDMRRHTWSYTMTLQVLRVIDGDLEDVTP